MCGRNIYHTIITHAHTHTSCVEHVLIMWAEFYYTYNHHMCFITLETEWLERKYTIHIFCVCACVSLNMPESEYMCV